MQQPFWIQWRHIWNRENRQVLPVKACNHLDECLLWGPPDVPIPSAHIFGVGFWVLTRHGHKVFGALWGSQQLKNHRSNDPSHAPWNKLSEKKQKTKYPLQKKKDLFIPLPAPFYQRVKYSLFVSSGWVSSNASSDYSSTFPLCQLPPLLWGNWAQTLRLDGDCLVESIHPSWFLGFQMNHVCLQETGFGIQ